jgi:hypothetical protein
MDYAEGRKGDLFVTLEALQRANILELRKLWVCDLLRR